MSKQFQITIRAFNDKGQKYDLPILENVGLNLDISAIEAGSIGSLFGISSQNISIPGTDTVNQFFNNLFDLGTTPAVAFYKSVPCQLLVDSEEVFTGRMYVDNITSDDSNDVVYNCVLINETIDFKNQIENKTLSDFSGSWSKYNHTLTWTNISSSWNNRLFNGSIFYPLINYGSNVNDPTSPSTQFSPQGTFSLALTNSIDNPNQGLKTTQFKPAIQVKTIVDTIFDSLNYKYSSSFFDTDYFKSIYYLSTADDKEGTTFINYVSQSSQATPNVFQPINANVVGVKINYGQALTNPGNYYNFVNSTYTAPVSGSYTIETSLQFYLTNFTAVNRSRTFVLGILVNGVAVHNTTTPFVNAISGKISMPPTTIALQAGDVVTIFGRFISPSSSEVFNIVPGQGNSWLKVIASTVAAGSTVDVSKIFTSDMTVRGFIKGLQEKFNLVIEPLRNQRNILSIEPYQTWVDNGTIVDWSRIVDHNIKYKVSAPIQQSPTRIKFTDILDQDVINQNEFSKENKIFGEYNYTSNSDLTAGEKTIGNYFGATPTKNIINSNTIEVPWLCKEESSKALVPMTFKGRILHKTPVADVPKNEARGGTYYIYDASLVNPVIPVTYWSTLLPTYRTPTIIIPGNIRSYSNPINTLHYDGTKWAKFTPPFPTTTYVPGAYFNYWASWINQIYDVDVRMLTCNVVLKPIEIKNIQLNDKIFIDGQYYRINKISGASLTETTSVVVELLKTIPRQLNYTGRRRIVTVR